MRPFRLIGIVCLWLASASLALLPAQFVQHRRKAFQVAPGSGTNPGTSNLEAWWNFEANGNDSSGNSRTLFNADLAPSYTAGLVGNALDTSAGNRYWVERADAAWMQPAGAFSIGAWAKFNDGQYTASQGVITQFSSVGNRAYSLRVNSTGNVAFIVSGDGTNLVINTSSVTIPNGATGWYLFVGVFVPSTSTKIYVASTSVAPAVVTETTSIPARVYDSSTTLDVGTIDRTSANALIGQIDSAFFYSKELTADDVTWLWNNGLGRQYSEL